MFKATIRKFLDLASKSVKVQQVHDVGRMRALSACTCRQWEEHRALYAQIW